MLDEETLKKAEAALAAATAALESGAVEPSRAATTSARERLEEVQKAAAEKLERLKSLRDFRGMKSAQDATRDATRELAEKMKQAPPLVSTPDQGVPGRQELEAAQENQGGASQSLGQGSARGASRSQQKALDQLKSGREKSEETLEELQKALRDRILAYLREKLTRMLNDQRAITRETRSLDLKLRALRAASAANGSAAFEPDRKDRQTADTLAARENALTAITADVIDLLAEDGTTLVFPGVIDEIRLDVENAAGLLSRIQTGDTTQHVQVEVETALEDILKALEVAQKNPPPPNPNQGRSSKSGAGPLLPLSSELKMVRALQDRVNERTRSFDLKRSPAQLSPEEKLQLGAVQTKQKEVEEMLRKLGQAVGEQ